MSDALNDVLAQAQAAAATFVQPQGAGNTNALTAAPTTTNALAKPSMESALTGGGMTVDEYLQSKAEGFRISKEMKGLLEEIVVDIDMTDVTFIYSSRHESGGQTKFLKSYDGVTTDSGQNFQAAINAAAAGPGVKSSGIYQSVEIPCELVEDVKDPKSTLVVHAGTMVGITPSVTGFKEFQKWLKKLAKEDPSLLKNTIRAKVTHMKRTNSNNNEWGVVTFEKIAA